MPRDLTTLLHDTAVAPSERPDVDRLVQRGRRRRRTRHAMGATTAAGALAGVVMVGASLLGAPQPPTVADQPDQSDHTAPAPIEIPEGWTTVVAGDLALSVPPGWTHAFAAFREAPSPSDVCRIAFPPPEGSQYSPGVMVDLGPPTAFPCGPETVLEAPRQPVVWFLPMSSTGSEVRDARERGSLTRIGSVDVWRVDQPPLVSYVATDGSGVLWASPANHPELDAVLATLRRATADDHRAFDALRRQRSPMPWNPIVLTPSQSAEDAARDGVLPAVAALPFRARVGIQVWDWPTEVVTDQGVWLASRITPLAREYSSGCGIGDVHNPDAGNILDVICDVEYGEVLLLNHDRDRILRAFPLPSVPPQTLLVTDDAVYCARQGDGGLPNSMLCRIDRATGEWTVRLFRHEVDGQDPWPPADVLPDHWILDRLPNDVTGSMYGPLRMDYGDLVIDHDGRVTRFDPDTLELLAN